MKKFLSVLLLLAVILTGCAATQPVDDSVSNDNSNSGIIENDIPNSNGNNAESTSAVTEDTSASFYEVSGEITEPESEYDVITEVSTDTTTAQTKKNNFPSRDELLAHADGVEVSIFKDNTFECDYADYKEIEYDFVYQRRSVMAPKDWCSFRFYGEETQYENRLLGTPIYDRPLSVEINMWDDSTKFANYPDTDAVFFLAEYPWQYGEDYLNDKDLIYKYDYEYYTDAKGRTMTVYFWEGMPKYAVYDNYFFLCIVFNLSSQDQIPTVVNMVNSVEVSLSREAEFALNTASRLGYTIIPPEE